MQIRKTLNKQDIINNSIALFGEYGVDNISMNDIANSCNIKKASLYSHFKSRDLIISEAYRYGLKIYYEKIDSIYQQDQLPFLTKMEYMVIAILRLHDEDVNLFRFLVMNQYAQIKIPTVIDGINIVEYLSQILKENMEKGNIPQKDADVLALSITGIIIQQSVGLMFYRLHENLTHYQTIIWEMCKTLILMN